jgi:hypothetical protein
LLRSAGGWRKSLYLITIGFSRRADDFECRGLAGAGHTLNSLNTIARAEYIFDDGFLSAV